MAGVTLFVDTGVLLQGMIDFGESSLPAQAIMDAIAAGKVAKPLTAWHCCLEFFSVSTRLPEEYRLSTEDAVRLLREEILSRFRVHGLPANKRVSFWEDILLDRIQGGRVYDAHIAGIAVAAGATVVVTENRKDFLGLLRENIRVLTAAELAGELHLG